MHVLTYGLVCQCKWTEGKCHRGSFRFDSDAELPKAGCEKFLLLNIQLCTFNLTEDMVSVKKVL